MSKKLNKSNENTVSNYLADMLAAFDARASYEASKNADNSNMQETLKDLRKSVNHDAIASVMLAANLDASFINRAERNNSRFNVYSAQKVVNVARHAASAATLNHYTKAILASLVAFKKANVDFTHKDAIASCSIDSKVNKAKDSLLVRYQKVVAANTASTQASSSVNALQMMHIVNETRNAANETCYVLNDNEIAVKLIEALSA